MDFDEFGNPKNIYTLSPEDNLSGLLHDLSQSQPRRADPFRGIKDSFDEWLKLMFSGDLLSADFWFLLTWKNDDFPYPATPVWDLCHPQPYRHPPTRMELDRKYRGMNDIKLTGIDAYMNRDKDIPNCSNEAEVIHLGG